MSKIQIRKVSITEVGTDAIVNAANEGLWAGSGVCGVIFDAAGKEELTKACNAIGHCDTGSAVITPGFKLSKYIIHAVGPSWSSDEGKVKKQLYNAYKTSLRLAVENGCKSIGFPLISAGIFGVPVDIAWRKALQACTDYESDIQIVFAVLNNSIIQAGKQALNDLVSSKDANKSELNDSMIIFHDVDKEYGFLSNWYLSDFYADGICFTSVEQYLMYQKAVLFGDKEMASSILKTNDPSLIKNYGQKVKPFNSVVWNGARIIILYRALKNKFSQNTELRRKLLETNNKILVEGTASDKIYANGLTRNDPDRFDMSKWTGKNYLGFALMEIRKELNS